MPTKNLAKLFRPAAGIVEKLTPAAASPSTKDLVLKQYISAIDTSTSTSKTIRQQLLNYKSPKSQSAPSSSSPYNNSSGDFTGIGNLRLLSAADNDNEESAKQLSAEILSISSDPNFGEEDKHYGTVVEPPWNSMASNNPSVRRKEISRERKLRWISNSNSSAHFGRLIGKTPDATTIQCLSKLGQVTGEKEFNAWIMLCIENARKTDDEEASLNQIFRAYKILEMMKERGFKLEEMSYGPCLKYLIDCSLVREFHDFCELLRDENSLPSFAYYEMLLYIKVRDEEKIQELLGSLALYNDEGKSSFLQSYLLAFCDGGRVKELVSLLDTFDITKVSSLESLTKVFKSLGKLSLESVAERFLTTLKVNGIGVDHISSFIFNYAVSNLNSPIEDVISNFKNLHATVEMVPLSGQYEKLIRRCCSLLKVHKALDIVDEMFKVGYTLSMKTCHSLLDALDDSKEYNLVRRIYSLICCHDLKPNTDTFRKMIHLSVKMKDFEAAYGMIDDLWKLNLIPTTSIYNILMAGYFREKNIQGAVRVLKQMKVADINPDAQTYSYLLVNCHSEKDIGTIYEEIRQSGVYVTKHVYMALINAYAAFGKFEQAKQVALDDRIPAKNLNEIKSVLVSALASNGRMSEALSIFSEMKQADCGLEPKAAICLIEHLQSSEGELNKLLQLLKESENSSYWIDGCYRVILYCIRHEDLSTTLDLLRKLKDKLGMVEEEAGNMFVLLFCQIAESEPTDMQFAMDLLQTIKKEFNTPPSRKILDFLLAASINAKDLKTCNWIWREYKEVGLPYSWESYLRMYQALLLLGDQKSASVILDKITIDDPEIKLDDPHVKFVVQAYQQMYRGLCLKKGKKKKKQ